MYLYLIRKPERLFRVRLGLKIWILIRPSGPWHAIWLWLDSKILLVRSLYIGDPAVPREGMGGRDEPTENGSQKVGGLQGKGTAQ